MTPSSGFLRIPLVVGAVALAFACTNRERAPYDFERMRLQQRYDVYDSSRVFASGGVLQAPPAGTVARETMAEPAATAGNAAVPVEVTPALLREGRDRYAIYCAVCHGPAGFGGSIVAANMGPPRPKSLRSAEARALPASTFYAIITDGVGRMPSHAWQLPVAQRWAIVAYVQALQRAPVTDAEAIADSINAARLAAIDRRGARPASSAGGAP